MPVAPPRRTAEGGSGLRRSLRLLRAFRAEQSDPERFYRLLAEDSVRELSRYTRLEGRSVLDVGGGPGWFAEAFSGAGARYHGVERDPGELAELAGAARRAPRQRARAVLADAAALPFADGSFDLCFSSNVLEHVAAPWALLEEMVRCVRRDGVVFCAFTNWLSPWGGHETSPWHLLGGDRAARRYERRRGRPPKNRYGVTLFPVHVGEVLGWARRHPAVELVDARPRYHPGWCRHVVEVPGLREVATWNLALVLRRR